MPYSFLGQTYRRYWQAKVNSYWNDEIRSRNPEQSELIVLASSRLGISCEEYIQKYLTPWYDLDSVSLKQLVSALTLFSNKYFVKPVTITVESKVDNRLRTIDWLTVQLLDLKLDGFREGFIGEALQDEQGNLLSIPISPYSPPFNRVYQRPYQQCFYCGRLDSAEDGNLFNNKNKYCHKMDCERVSNPDAHEAGCCYKSVVLARKTLKQKLSRLQAKNAPDREMRKVFTEFTRERLRYIGTTVAWDIRTESEYLRASERMGGAR